MNEDSKPLGLNILVVDDEPNIRKMLSFCLAGEGHSETIAMFLGRLELTIVFVSLAKIGADARDASIRLAG